MELMQQTAAVAGVLALLLATLWWLRRHGFAAIHRGNKSNTRRLECIERLSLGPQQSLHLIRLEGTLLLLASSPAGCSLITRIAQDGPQ